ncbi:unnamed protein product, partial [marine sediment metagenome]
MITPEFKSRIKTIVGIIGGFLFIKGVGMIIPDLEVGAYLILGIIFLMY